ncbi:hypothetical protein SAMN05421766_10612 [Zobellia uliginosa]|uniref:Uncharacterized protein n=1 Tax=Zobellia uliginosa TaxID=143224 RepID=A0ABY1KZE9_9FLAO|nr:hypothetical protein [Zobellia uliginosa]SIS97515.1 hypothetical protein SAMN05421766_10612 [Zobellia uliginosa]
MIECNNLIEEMLNTERILVKSKKEKYSNSIDINDDDWLDIAKKQKNAFYNENRNIIELISKKLIENFPKYDAIQRNKIINTFSNLENLKSLVSSTNLNDKSSIDWFHEKILFFILNDLGDDTRDALLEIDELKKLSRKNNIDLKNIIKKYLAFANDKNKHGMGSVKSIFNDIISG